MREQRIDRRKFLSETGRLMVLVSTFSTLTCACAPEPDTTSSTREITIENGKIIIDLNTPPFHTLDTVGNGVKIVIATEAKPLIITRLGRHEIAAFSSQCPHAGYEVMLPERGSLMCASGHGAVFDLAGRVVKGPAKSDLLRFPAEIKDNKIIVTYSLQG